MSKDNVSGRHTPPASPAISRSLINPNIYADISAGQESESPSQPVLTSTAELLGGLAATLTEFSPRSASSSDECGYQDFVTPTKVGKESSEQEKGKINQANIANQPTSATVSSVNPSNTHTRSSKNNSTMNSRAASTDEEEVTILAEEVDLTGLPSALIVANLPESIFRLPEVKAEFESMYRTVDPCVTFGYFKCFRRARLAFSSPIIATRVRLLSHGSLFHGNKIKVYYHETVSSGPRELHPPALEKQFLISPPASPPVGWEQNREASPIAGAVSAGILTPSVMPRGPGPITEDIVDAVQQKLVLKQSPAANITGMELMAALAKLVPGEQTEILSPTPDGKPGIVIETCEDAPRGISGKKIQQTRCPDRKH